jgi:hypothetical protein
VRKALKQADTDEHLRTTFNRAEFWRSMLYESLPPLVNAAVAILLEGPVRGYHLVNHRLFFPVEKSYQRSNPAIIYVFWFIFIPLFAFCHSSYFLFFLNSEALKYVRERASERKRCMG